MRQKGQKAFAFPNKHGGNRKYDWARKRKRKGRKCPVPHRRRGDARAREPLHVTMRVVQGLPNLRRPEVFRVVRGALKSGASKPGFRLNHFSVQSNHLHLVVEVDDGVALSRWMGGLATRIAKRLNKLLDRSGQVFAERFHSVVLKTARQVRNALLYVMNNVLRHGGRVTRRGPDPCSSGKWFDGWKDYQARSPDDESCPIVPARSYLQRVVWRRYGLLPLRACPKTNA